VFTDGRALRGPAALTTAALALGCAVTHAGPGVTALGPVRRRFFPRLSGQGRADHVAVTFDDGPDPAWTPAFLDALATWRVRATFFMLGSMAAREPGLAAEVAAAGHEVAVHGWAHRYTVLRGPGAVADDLARARDALAEATGAQPRFYRPPYGVLSTGALAAARRLRLTPVPGVDARRHAAHGLRGADPGPRRRRHGAAARLRLHLAAGIRRGGAGRPAAASRRMCHTTRRGGPSRRPRPGRVTRGHQAKWSPGEPSAGLQLPFRDVVLTGTAHG